MFVTSRDGNAEIYVADADGRNPVRLTNDPANDREPAWSPDGTQIAFSSGLETSDGWRTPGRDSIADLRDGRRRLQPPSHHRRIHRSRSESPRVAFSRPQRSDVVTRWVPIGFRCSTNATAAGPHGRGFTVYTVDPAGGGSPVEIWSDGGGWSLRWSPDGTRLSIHSTGNYSIDSTTVIAAADGSGTPLQLAGESGADRRVGRPTGRTSPT